MPVIKEYRQQTSAPGPIQRVEYSADQFGAAEGRALVQAGQAVQGVADVVAKRIDQENTSDITQKVTKANADLAIDLQETIRTAEPGDKKAFEDYNKRVEDTLGKIGEDASTGGARAFFGEASERIKGQLYKTSAQGQSELAGMKAVQDYTSSINNLSSAVAADPSSQKLQFELHNQAIENLVANGQLPRHKAAELKTDGELALTKATVRGWANLNPGYASEKLKSGEFDKILGAEGKIQLQGEIEQAVRAKEIDQERSIKLQERNLKIQQTQTQNDFLTAIEENKLTAKDILLSNLDPTGGGSKEQFLNMLEKANSSESRLKTNANTMIDLYGRIHLPDGDPRKITDENEINPYLGNGLSFSDVKHLRDEIQGRGTDAGRIESDYKKQLMAQANAKLVKTNAMGLKDPVGEENMLRFMQYFEAEYKERRKKGDTALELLSPDSPKYLGKMVNTLQRDNREIMKDMVRRKSPVPTPGVVQVTVPRLPGESPADWKKRKDAAKGSN